MPRHGVSVSKTMRNEMRAKIKRSVRRVDAALVWHSDDYDKEDPYTAVVDLLADIRHFCDKHAINYAEADKSAHEHYLGEFQDANK